MVAFAFIHRSADGQIRSDTRYRAQAAMARVTPMIATDIAPAAASRVWSRSKTVRASERERVRNLNEEAVRRAAIGLVRGRSQREIVSSG